MKDPHEDLEASLRCELARRFNTPPASISVKGEDVNWRCTATLGNSVGTIAFFDSFGPHYHIDFERDGAKIAEARTTSRDQTIDVVADWLSGFDLPTLYEKYAFVDKARRTLLQLRDDVLAATPELGRRAQHELRYQMYSYHYLLFTSGDRACEISLRAHNELPDAEFLWDECPLFGFQPIETSQFAAVLKRWLCDRSPPSAIREAFPWIKIGELADYYETGRPIEGEFIQSWNSVEEYYAQDWCTYSDAVLGMIHTLREAGYDRVLRAGQSFTSFVLSRSRRHGLRIGQASVYFEFREPVMDVHANFMGEVLKAQPIGFSKDLQRLVDALVELDVD